MRIGVAGIILLLGLSGCARVFNESTTSIKIYSSRPTKLSVEGTEYWVHQKTKINVLRKDSVLAITAATDSVSKVYYLKPKYSFNYYANVFTYGLGFIWDTNEKRYTYRKNIYLNFNSTNKKPDRFAPFQKGSTYWRLSFPWVNSFYVKPSGQPTKSNTGFWGISLGLDHYYKSNKFVSGTISGNMDVYIPIVAAIDIYGDYEVLSTVYGSITDNFQFKDFSIGYGLHYSKNTWLFSSDRTVNNLPSSTFTISKSSESIGLILNGYYRLSDHFSIGVIYRPNFYTIKPFAQFNYEHLISLDFSWKFRLGKEH
ncbi:MAG: hypothetical protein HOP30_04605 [Cyclobacteriaceae bacterium]|nr:hypothetical protein [Cyclobacteriaceae bacterium]